VIPEDTKLRPQGAAVAERDSLRGQLRCRRRRRTLRSSKVMPSRSTSSGPPSNQDIVWAGAFSACLNLLRMLTIGWPAYILRRPAQPLSYSSCMSTCGTAVDTPITELAVDRWSVLRPPKPSEKCWSR